MAKFFAEAEKQKFLLSIPKFSFSGELFSGIDISGRKSRTSNVDQHWYYILFDSLILEFFLFNCSLEDICN